jgi:hypothetical protein
LQRQIASNRIGGAYLDFDSQNRPHVGYVDTTNQQLKHAYWNGNSWTTRVVATSPDFRFTFSSLIATLDDNDQMHFTWDSFDQGVLKYAKPTGSTWQVTTPFGAIDAFPYDIDVDAAGNAHLAYNVFTGSTLTGGLFYSSQNGSTWQGGRVSGLDGSGGGRSKVVVDAMGEPHLFTYDSTFSGPETLKHVYRSNNAWISETIDSYTGGLSGPDEIEATIDDAGMHVVYSTGHETVHYAFLSTQGSPGDFDGDGDVDGRDFLKWQRSDSPDPLSAGDLADWKSNYGNSNLTASATAVPEPDGLVLIVLTSVLAVVYRE